MSVLRSQTGSLSRSASLAPAQQQQSRGELVFSSMATAQEWANQQGLDLKSILAYQAQASQNASRAVSARQTTRPSSLRELTATAGQSRQASLRAASQPPAQSRGELVFSTMGSAQKWAQSQGHDIHELLRQQAQNEAAQKQENSVQSRQTTPVVAASGYASRLTSARQPLQFQRVQSASVLSQQQRPQTQVYASQQQQQRPQSQALVSQQKQQNEDASQALSQRQSTPTARQPSNLRRSATYAGSRNVEQLLNNVETLLRNAQTPVQFPNARRQVQAGQYNGVQLNDEEEQQFQGPLSLSQYQINQDPNPEVLRKRLGPVKYQQEVAVRHLRPPTPPAPGRLIIKERRAQLPPAPAIVLRQEGQRAQSPCPIVYREQPPKAPSPVPEQTVEVQGQPLAPQARKIVFERLPDQPQKPAPILIEKWLNLFIRKF